MLQHDPKWKEPAIKDHVFYDSIYVQRLQICRYRKQTSGHLGMGLETEVNCKWA